MLLFLNSFVFFISKELIMSGDLVESFDLKNLLKKFMKYFLLTFVIAQGLRTYISKIIILYKVIGSLGLLKQRGDFIIDTKKTSSKNRVICYLSILFFNVGWGTGQNPNYLYEHSLLLFL